MRLTEHVVEIQCSVVVRLDCLVNVSKLIATSDRVAIGKFGPIESAVGRPLERHVPLLDVVRVVERRSGPHEAVVPPDAAGPAGASTTGPCPIQITGRTSASRGPAKVRFIERNRAGHSAAAPRSLRTIRSG